MDWSCTGKALFGGFIRMQVWMEFRFAFEVVVVSIDWSTNNNTESNQFDWQQLRSHRWSDCSVLVHCLISGSAFRSFVGNYTQWFRFFLFECLLTTIWSSQVTWLKCAENIGCNWFELFRAFIKQTAGWMSICWLVVPISRSFKAYAPTCLESWWWPLAGVYYSR